MNQLLVVDDHRAIREPLAAYLRKQGFEVSTSNDGPTTRARLEERRFDLIVLDLMLPGEDGLSLCGHIRSRYGTPIIMLTARAEYGERIAGLNLGADDYVTKPFNIDELVARVRSVLRRAGTSVAPIEQTQGVLEFEGWSLDLLHRRLSSRHGIEVPLSTTEFQLLLIFLEHPNRALSRDTLLALSSRENASFDRSIDSQISRLRKKLEHDPQHPTLLKTIWGNGYLLAAQVHRKAT